VRGRENRTRQPREAWGGGGLGASPEARRAWGGTWRPRGRPRAADDRPRQTGPGPAAGGYPAAGSSHPSRRTARETRPEDPGPVVRGGVWGEAGATGKGAWCGAGRSEHPFPPTNPTTQPRGNVAVRSGGRGTPEKTTGCGAR
ncbi:unnamed protein product, partial [Rangifer tarandus platyrhynchus]